MWAKCYKAARTTVRKKRLDKGRLKPRQAPDGGKTETSWLHKRRLDVALATSRMQNDEDLLSDPNRVVGDSGWTPKHEKEADYQRDKRAKRHYNSVLSGEINVDGLSEAQIETLVAQSDREAKRYKDYAATQA